MFMNHDMPCAMASHLLCSSMLPLRAGSDGNGDGDGDDDDGRLNQ